MVMPWKGFTGDVVFWTPRAAGQFEDWLAVGGDPVPAEVSVQQGHRDASPGDFSNCNRYTGVCRSK
jgi:hypothetical protein